MTQIINIKDILLNKNDFIGHIIAVDTKIVGIHWVVLRDVELLNDGSINLTFKMITHNHRIGIKSVKISPEQTLPFQRIEDFTKWCNMYNISMNLYTS